MGSCSSSEPNSSEANPGPLVGVRSDGAVENSTVHQGAILGIASAGRGEFLTCGEDKTLRLHDHVDTSGSFRSRVNFSGHSKPVRRALYGSVTNRIYSCSQDRTVRLWDRPGPSESSLAALRVFQGHTLACTALALSADERTLCSGSRDTSIRAWDVETGACTITAREPRNIVTCLKHLSSESPFTVIQASEDLSLKVWDLRQGGLAPVMIIQGYTYFPLCLDVSEHSPEILTSSKGFDGAGCEAKLWDLRRTSSPVREYTGHTQDTTACVFLRGKAWTAAGAKGVEWEGAGVDTCGPEEGGTPPGAHRRMIATASKDGTIKIYDLSSGNILVDYAEDNCGGYTGIAVDEGGDSSSSTKECPLLYASTITGGLYALRLETGVAAATTTTTMTTKESDREETGGLRFRCIGFVHGNTIV